MSMLKSLIAFSLIKFICYHKTEICSMDLGAVEPYVCVDHNDVTRVNCGLHVTVTLPPAPPGARVTRSGRSLLFFLLLSTTA